MCKEISFNASELKVLEEHIRNFFQKNVEESVLSIRSDVGCLSQGTKNLSWSKKLDKSVLQELALKVSKVLLENLENVRIEHKVVLSVIKSLKRLKLDYTKEYIRLLAYKELYCRVRSCWYNREYYTKNKQSEKARTKSWRRGNEDAVILYSIAHAINRFEILAKEKYDGKFDVEIARLRVIVTVIGHTIKKDVLKENKNV